MKHCSLCKIPAVIKQGHQWLCVRHYRFRQMRSCARRRGKTVPSCQELELMVPKNMQCPGCSRTMVWRSKEGPATVISLQHDRSGKMRMLCRSCNTRHAAFMGDSFYTHDQTKRVCPRCKQLLDWNHFSTDRTPRWKNKNTYCRQCRTEMHAAWVAKNRERENAKRRDYYHQRKACGNPIPR